QTCLCHTGNRVHFENRRWAVLRQQHVDPAINLQSKGTESAQGHLLNFVGLSCVNPGRTNVLRAPAGLWIKKGILVVEIIEAAPGDDLENWQGLISQDAYG